MKKSVLEPTVLEEVFQNGRNALNLDAKVERLQLLRVSEEMSCQVDRALLERLGVMQQGLECARVSQRELKALLGKLGATPWFPATYIQPVHTPEGPRGIVQCGTTRRLVSFSDNIDPSHLGPGNEVFLGNELNVIMAKSPNEVPRGGETAQFERKTDDGRLILRCHDEELVVDPAAAIKDVSFTAGDQVRWDRSVWMAFERIERSKGGNLFLEETPDVSFAHIGGLEPQVDRVKRCIQLHLFHAETARKYGLRRKGSILLVGPSGTGKTMLARALANWLATLAPGKRSRFMNIKPSGLHSMWYGQSEANYREAFRVAREAGESDPGVPIVMFFDEVDSIGMSRGHANSHVDDRVLLAFMAELDGLSSRGNIIVVAATNRRDALDPALLRPGRLGDLVLEVPRPKMKAAREIFTRYLGTEIPYAQNGHGKDFAATREDIVSSAVSRIFAPNGDTELATLTFRDGKRRGVRAADLVSGALIANIAHSAIERACLREIESGEAGLREEDVHTSLSEEFEAAARVLMPHNCRNHLTDLPQDMDVVSVEIRARKVKEPHRYLNLQSH